MTPGPTDRRPRLLRVTTSIQLCFAWYSARICGVLSVDPSSTMIHLVGRIDWLMTESSVSRMYFASSRHGEISKYLQWTNLEGISAVEASAEDLELSVFPILSRAVMHQTKLSKAKFEPRISVSQPDDLFNRNLTTVL